MNSNDKPISPYSVVTIGNFDGCHLGHKTLIDKSRELARRLNAFNVVLTFSPNPKEYFRPGSLPGQLFQMTQKIRALEELAVDLLVIQVFDEQFSLLSPDSFFSALLKRSLNSKAIVVGQDFRFGAKRSGDIHLLQTFCQENDVYLEILEQRTQDSTAISSSRIRTLLKDGRVEEANQLLGRPYLLEGKVVHGKKLARSLGFPTANLSVEGQLIPAFGVYAGYLVKSQEPKIFSVPTDAMKAVVNIGIRPTVDATTVASVSVEVHVLDKNIGADEFYDETFGLYLVSYLRPEKKFENLDLLKNQIALDKQETQKILQRNPL